MDAFATWQLPGIDASQVTAQLRTFGTAELAVAQLTPAQLDRVCLHLAAARAALLATPTQDIVAAIDAVAARIAQSAEARTLLHAVTGYSPATIEDVLAHMTRDWSAPSLNALLVAELGSEQGIDRRPQQRTVARGPRFAYHVFAGNVPGVAVTSIIRSLLVKAPTLGKSAAGEPVLPALFARELKTVAPALAEALAIAYWPGGTEELEAIALHAADTVVVYGGDDVVRSISARARPDARLAVHGPKLSIGVVGAGAERGLPAAIAAATAAYDQQGCVSPHVVFVSREGPDPVRLAQAVAGELARLAVSHPARRLAPAEALAIRAVRTRAEFGDGREVFAPDDTSYTVVYDADATLVTSCLNRTLFVKPFTSLAGLRAVLEPHHAILQSAAVAGFDGEGKQQLEDLLIDCGITRITTFEQLPWPPMTWHHDGRGPLRELLAWHDLTP